MQINYSNLWLLKLIKMNLVKLKLLLSLGMISKSKVLTIFLKSVRHLFHSEECVNHVAIDPVETD